MQKHIALVKALDHLHDKLVPDFFEVVDHWTGDCLAVGIASPRDANQLVYIACTESVPSSYTAILECASAPGADVPYEECGDFTELDIDGLADVVSAHLLCQSAGGNS